jgi:hypothetical protein
MDTERFDKLKVRYDLKNRNGADSSVEFWTMIEEYLKDDPNMDLEEVRRLTLREYCSLFKGFPDVDAVTNIKQMLKYFKGVINEFENIVKLNFPERWKQERLAEGEEKLSILLGNMSDLILDYVGDPSETQDEENSSLWQDDESLEKEIVIYMRALHENVNIHNVGIDKYYFQSIIPYYKKIYETAKEALDQNDEYLLWQVAEVSTCRVVFRSKILAYILS